ncbi:MAG TPA: hypothetical protein VK975_01255 [Acidimicrobiales bacterium]|nr:hypothetical protein [Acidimicrobiales bacterium]
MPPRYPSLRMPPLALAGVGALDASIDEILAALARALVPGSFGIEGQVWLSADGQLVVHHDATVRVGLRRRALSELRRSELPDHVVSLERLLDACGADAHVVVSAGDDATAAAVAERAGATAGRVWLRGDDWRQVAGWRSLSSEVGLVEATRLRRLTPGPERHASVLAGAGIDAVQLPEADWTAGLTTLFHRFGRLAFAGPAAHRRQLDALLDMGVDAVSSDQVERLVEALSAPTRPPTAGSGRSAATP